MMTTSFEREFVVSKAENMCKITEQYEHKIYTCVYNNSGHYPSSCLLFKKQNVSEIGFSIRVQMEPIQMDPTERTSLCIRIYSTWKRKQNAVSEMLRLKEKIMDNVQNCDSYIYIPSSQTYR
jgi:hypothetical protein